MPTIRLEQDVFEGLQKLAQPFVDSPSTVIRRLLEKEGVLKKRAHTPASAGALTPQSVYEKYLLHILLNGGGHKRDVTHAVIKRMMKDGHIGAADQELVSTGETKAENSLTWARNALKDKGCISRVAARGLWELTAEGQVAASKVALPKAG
ncbi:MAG: winged helix-turn-helix domain-containing protein [Burkholderiales bacterium]